jgi:N-formylglutamate deformylase
MTTPAFTIELALDAPVAAAAIHDGHALRPDVANAMALDDATRRREEDPFTAQWTSVAGTRLIAHRSRFEVDLNRPRDKAVYRRPADAWGLHVWRDAPSASLVDASLALYDDFYDAAHQTFSALRERWGRFVVLDLHSYNHRRDGADAPAADPDGNPEVNIGTGIMDRARWAPVVDRFVEDLRQADVLGRPLDVRENVKFRGGHFSDWIHRCFPEAGCAIAIEFRKSFMDEWTGEPDAERVSALGRALASTIPGLLATLEEMK